MTKHEQNIDDDAYLDHWAEYWCITEQRKIFAKKSNSPDLAKVDAEHEEAKRRLRESVFLTRRAKEASEKNSQEAHHG